jgi:hypothetical protein
MRCSGLAHGTVVTAPRQVSRLKISFANKHDFTNRVYILTAFIFSRNSPRGLIIARAKHPASFLGRKFLRGNFKGRKICRGNSQLDKFVEEIFGPAKTVDYYFVRSSLSNQNISRQCSSNQLRLFNTHDPNFPSQFTPSDTAPR